MIDKTKARRIDDWSTDGETSPWLAPECRWINLVGKIDGSAKTSVTTPIVAVDGLFVQTKSGSVYELGTPQPEFVDWLASIGKPFDPVNPIKVLP